MNNFEIEIKSLLGGKEKADELVAKMRAKDPQLVQHETHKQLNHYFVGGNLEDLYENTKPLIKDADQLKKFEDIITKAKTFSVRTRQADGKVILVIKASIDDTTSSNGTARIEFESTVPVSLEELDSLVLKSGFKYQAKWSRERTDYKFLDTSVSIDKNAGYGYLAEFEKVITDQALAEKTKEELRELMSELGVSELPQDRLERMFAYYNANWPEYYGTDRIFTIE